MGAEFSRLGYALRSFPSPPPAYPSSSSPSSSSSSSRSAVNYLFDAKTRANTRANRSSTPVSKHVALARLADRLAALGHRQRIRAIRSLRLSPRVLRQLGRYAPLHLFCSAASTGLAGNKADHVNSPRLTGQGQDCDPPFNPVSLGKPISAASVTVEMTTMVVATGGTAKKWKKSVSFAPLAEMRTFVA